MPTHSAYRSNWMGQSKITTQGQDTKATESLQAQLNVTINSKSASCCSPCVFHSKPDFEQKKMVECNGKFRNEEQTKGSG